MKSAPFLCALIAALLIPFLLVDVPPVLDYPNHLARWFVLAHPDDPILSRFWKPHWSIIPNLGFDLIGLGLMKILPVHLAGRLMLGLSLLAPVAGAMIYSRAAFGRWCGWALASGLAAYSGIFFLGFMNFLLGVGLGFAAAGLWLSLDRRSDAEAVLAGALASGLLFFCHIFGVALFGLLIASAEAERLWARRKKLTANTVLRRLGLLLLTLSPALILYAVSPLAGGAAAPGEWEGADKAWNLLTAFMSPSKPLTLVTVCGVMAFLILTGRGARYAPGARLALVVLLLLFLWAPDTFKGGTFLDVRLALMAGILLFAGIAPPPRQPRIWAIAFTGLILARSAVVAWSWHGHAADLADFRAAIAHVSPGAKVLAAQGPAPERLVIPGLYRLDSHMPALLAIERRAFWPLMFADPSQQPLIVRPPYDRIASPPLGETPDWDMLTAPVTPAVVAEVPYLKNWRADFDYVLLIDRPATLAPPAGLTLVTAGSYAALYRINR